MSEQREKIGKLIKIADSSDAVAQTEYGRLLLEGGNGVVKNEKKAKKYLSKPADSKRRGFERGGCDGEGYPLASYYLGLLFLRKYGFGDQNVWTYFDKAARRGGIVNAMVMLARIGKEAKVSYEKTQCSGPLGYHKVEDLLLPCAWAYLAQARARDRAEADKLVQHFEQEEPLTAKNPDLLEESIDNAEKWNRGDQSIVWEAKPPSIDEIIEKHEKRSGKPTMKNEPSSEPIGEFGEPINTLLISHYLCKTALENKVVVEEKYGNRRVPFITDALLWHSVSMYYSIFKTPEPKTKEKEKFRKKLKEYKTEDENEEESKCEDVSLTRAFDYFLLLRDKNIAHRDENKPKETLKLGISLVEDDSYEITQGEIRAISFPPRNELFRLSNKPYAILTYIKNISLQIMPFLDLIKATIKIYHSKEQPPLPPL